MLKIIGERLNEVENHKLPVTPKVTPGFLREKIPAKPPLKPEAME
jgi:hypothetical protein